jgi:hypothetical protein
VQCLFETRQCITGQAESRGQLIAAENLDKTPLGAVTG